MLSVGIDVSKSTLHVAVLRPGDKLRHKTCTNTPAGFQELAAWLTRHTPDPVHACLEATGPYGEAIALFLYDAGHTVSVVNPSIIHAYAKSQLLRAKADRVDAAVIARYCAKEQPLPWTPPAPELRQLQALVRRIDALHGMRTQEANRLTVTSDAVVRESIAALLATLDSQIAALKQRIATHLDQHPGLRVQRDLLLTIPGIGEATAAVLIAELFHKSYATARQAAAYAGATPRIRESGQWRGHASISRCGPALVRKALYFPALAALRFNPTIQAVHRRLAAKGKPKMVIIGAAMRHLIHVAFGVLKHQRAYDATAVRA
jgi:transposase